MTTEQGVVPDQNKAREVASRLAGRAEFRDVRLLRSEIDLHELPEMSDRLRFDVDTDVVCDYYDDGTSFVVRASYDLHIERVALPDSGVDATSIADVSFEYAALFEYELRDGDEAFSEAEFQAYAESTGRFGIHPYAREYIYDVTGRLGLPSLTIGVLKFAMTKPADLPTD